MMFMRCFRVFFVFFFCFFFFSDFLYKSICCGYSFEVVAIQMCTHNICLYKEVNNKYTGCDQKITEWLYCALIGICAVIRSSAYRGMCGDYVERL